MKGREGIELLKKNEKRGETDGKITLRFQEEPGSLFQRETGRRLGVGKNGRLLIGMGILLSLLILLSVFLMTDVLNHSWTLAEYIEMVKERFVNMASYLSGRGAVNGVNFSIYTFLIVALTGAALAVCGATYQGVFKNPMASPTLLGVESGGMLGAMIYVLIFIKEETAPFTYFTQADIMAAIDTMSIFQRNIQQFCILAGAFLGVFFIVGLSRAAGRGKISVVVLFLAGALFSSTVGTISSLVQYYLTLHDGSTDRVNALQYFSMGGFSRAFKLEHLLLMGAPILVCMTVLFIMSPNLNVFVFGEDEARAMGLNVDLFRTIMFVLCTVLAAIVISFCGQIGFVGLVVPHFARQMAGSDFRRLMPASALLGAIALVLVYDIACLAGFTGYLNLVTSLTGGLLFGIFMMKYRRNRNADWA